MTATTYAGDGKRRRMEESVLSRDLIWDRENVVREYDGATLAAAYTHAPQQYGHLVSQRRSGASSFHHFDALGSTERLTDASQNAVVSYFYRAFGCFGTPVPKPACWQHAGGRP